MLKFPSIESFRHAVATVKRNCDYQGIPLPVVKYRGLVKLHGTNAGIFIDWENKTLTPQSRERVLTVEADNAGFAAWVKKNEQDLFNFFFDQFEGFTFGSNVTVYGEWIGPGIQKNVAINNLPSKKFVWFASAYHDRVVQMDDGQTQCVWHAESGIYIRDDIFVPEGLDFIGRVPAVELMIDFVQPDSAVAELERLTAEYEAKCPFASYYGIEGIGEGLVWSPIGLVNGMNDLQLSRLWFKTKGEKHGNKATNNTVKVAVTADKIEDFNALITQILPDWRLEQGSAKILETRYALTVEQTGEYIKWVVSDVHKEELDVVEASEFEWKVVAAELSKRARTWFLNRTRL